MPGGGGAPNDGGGGAAYEGGAGIGGDGMDDGASNEEGASNEGGESNEDGASNEGGGGPSNAVGIGGGASSDEGASGAAASAGGYQLPSLASHQSEGVPGGGGGFDIASPSDSRALMMPARRPAAAYRGSDESGNRNGEGHERGLDTEHGQTLGPHLPPDGPDDLVAQLAKAGVDSVEP